MERSATYLFLGQRLQLPYPVEAATTKTLEKVSHRHLIVAGGFGDAVSHVGGREDRGAREELAKSEFLKSSQVSQVAEMLLDRPFSV